jgi:nicotinamide phosphoribosyltransferase
VEDHNCPNSNECTNNGCQNKCCGQIKKSYNIYKDPVTDDGTKKSLKGLLRVEQIEMATHAKEGSYICLTEQAPKEESKGLLQVIYEDGKFYNQTTFTEIRQRLLKV